MGKSSKRFAESLPYLINRVGSALANSFAQEALALEELNIPGWRVLVVLADYGPQRQIDLADLTSIEASTLSRLVARLGGMKLLARERSATSNREVVIELTTRGKRLVERLRPIARKYEQIAEKGLSSAEVEIVMRCLRRMHENIESAQDNPAD